MSAARTINYVYKDKKPEDPADGNLVSPEKDEAISQFKATRDAYNFDGGWQCLHVIQSFNKKDSQKLTPEEVNKMGMELVGERWKDHQFIVVTHTDTDNFHNHIVVNTIGMMDGSRIQRKYIHWHALADRNDELCQKRGLSVIERDPKTKRYKFPEKAKRMMEARGAHSYVHDIMQKANVAREYGTSYDEYRGYLNLLGIGVRVEDKNIAYFYPGKPRSKRGDKLGENYHKPGLEAQFKANDAKFAKNPSLRGEIPSALEAGKFYKAYQAPGKDKDYSAFTKTSRESDPFRELPGLKNAQGYLPFEELRKARSGNILEYCRDKKISLIDAGDGWHKLAKREHVQVKGDSWKNTKNKQEGSLIDFVAAHHQITYIQAVSKINNNPKLLLLEKEFGEVKHIMTPFTVPNTHRMEGRGALAKLSEVLKSNGADPKGAKSLLRNNRAHVSKEGVVHFMGKEEKDGAFEFTQSADGEYAKRKRGEFTKPFFASRGSGGKAVVFLDPFSFLRKQGQNALQPRHRREGILALMEPSEKVVDSYLKSNPHVKELQLATPAHRSQTQGELDFFNVLKAKFAPFGISVRSVPVEQTLSKEGKEHGIGL